MKCPTLSKYIILILPLIMCAAKPRNLKHKKAVPTKMHAVKKQAKKVVKSKAKKQVKKTRPKQVSPLTQFSQQKKVFENKKSSLATRLKAVLALQAAVKKIRSNNKFLSSARGLSLRKVTKGTLSIAKTKRLDKKATQQIKLSLDKMNAELSAWAKHLRQEIDKQFKRAAASKITRSPAVAPTSISIPAPIIITPPAVATAPIAPIGPRITSTAPTITPAPTHPAPPLISSAPRGPSPIVSITIPAPAIITPPTTPPEHILATSTTGEPSVFPAVHAPIPTAPSSAPEHITAIPTMVEEPPIVPDLHHNCLFCGDQIADHEPHQLPCGHTLCNHCLEEIVAATPTGTQAQCPICPHIHTPEHIIPEPIEPIPTELPGATTADPGYSTVHAPTTTVPADAHEPVVTVPPAIEEPPVAHEPHHDCLFCGDHVDEHASHQLTCGHTLCAHCLEEIIAATPIGTHPQCPICPHIQAPEHSIPTPAEAIGPTVPHTAADPVAPQPRQQCGICLEDQDGHNVYRLACEHIFCRECLNQIINTAIHDNTTEPLRCPNPDCMQPFNREDVINITQNPARLDAIDRIQTQEWITHHPTIRHCPTPDCRYLFVSDEHSRQTIQCPHCNHEYCSNCLLHHADNITCQEAQTDETSSRLHGHATPCPRCHIPIERTSGCDWMHCTCGQAFCYGCGGTDEHHEWPCRRPRVRSAEFTPYARNVEPRFRPAAHLPEFNPGIIRYGLPQPNLQALVDGPRR